jgi:hypothetical protein
VPHSVDDRGPLMIGSFLERRRGEAASSPTDSHAPHRQQIAHWKRGHWKRQPYGEGRSQRRLIWIKPYRTSDPD